MISVPASNLCTCGKPRNHYVNGVLRLKCADCNDRKSATVYVSSKGKSVRDVVCTPDAQDLLLQIDELLEDERYEFAEDTLSGIQQTVERYGTCSVKQKRAVQNIEDSKLRRH